MAQKQTTKKPVTKKTPLVTMAQLEAQVKETVKWRDEANASAREIESLRKCNEQLREAKKSLADAYEYDNSAEILIITILRKRASKNRAFILKRIMEVIYFDLESSRDATYINKSRAQEEVNACELEEQGYSEAINILDNLNS